MANEVARDLGGTWILERSENVDNYLIELGVGKCERRSYGNQYKQTLWVDGDVIHMGMECGKQNFSCDFKIGEEYEIKAGKCSKVLASWENGSLIVHTRRTDTGRLQIIERTRVGDKMVQTMTSNGVTCKRILKRIE